MFKNFTHRLQRTLDIIEGKFGLLVVCLTLATMIFITVFLFVSLLVLTGFWFLYIVMIALTINFVFAFIKAGGKDV